jgi:outer membrane protein OmpA-like peptidoglycan-associated protein
MSFSLRSIVQQTFLGICLSFPFCLYAQTDLLLNGGFEDINTCTEYNAECGVEGWFYLKDVKIRMLANEKDSVGLGKNSFGIFYNWAGYTNFSPVIGTILPCGLQAGKKYTFKGIISAQLNNVLVLVPGICTGERFYVPNRPFSTNLHPDSIVHIKPIDKINFFEFSYNFIATGKEKYLTFGTYIREDTTGHKKRLFGAQTVSLVLDNFQLFPEDSTETTCVLFSQNKKRIYEYNFRHKEMDYSLFGNGELKITFPKTDSNFITRKKEIVPIPKSDTLKLGDVLFDFNKANLKPVAMKMLNGYFANKPGQIDSIRIEGHTDSVGTDKRNMTLSLNRCKSVQSWLLKNIIAPSENIYLYGIGESKPVASNKTPAGRALNRRVEIIVFRKNLY